jgi:YihY family inner membrane protein
MNRVYGVANCGFVCERQRGFFVVIAFAALFGFATIAATVPTLFVRQSLGQYFETWALASGWVQVFGYVVALLAAVSLFLVIYRVVPNAGQRLADVWPGSLTAAVLFVTMAQAFPIYLRLAGQYNRLGAGFGFVSLLVGWFYVLAHVLLFGTYVNATYQTKRRRRRRQRQRRTS